MTSDDALRTQDRPFSHRSAGMWPLFLCPACAKRKSSGGRRLKMFRGLRQWVCGECVPKVSK